MLLAASVPSRRSLVRMLTAGVLVPCLPRLSGACETAGLLLLNSCDLEEIERLGAAGNPALEAEFSRLANEAEDWLRQGPWSVTGARPSDAPAAKHDFFSEDPYWWPDSTNSQAPYLERDGEVNPRCFAQNRDDLARMSNAALCLATAASLLPGDKDAARYARRAWEFVRVWFVDPDTRMNPNLEFGRAIRGRAWGRGPGLIDTAPLISLTQAVMLLIRLPSADRATEAAFRAWLRDFLRWMRTSEKGVDARDRPDHHATWWAAQVAAYATCVKDDQALIEAWKLYFEKIVPGQLLPAGAAPREEARALSLSSSAMNLDGLALLCRMGQFWGMELWEYEAPNGASVAKSAAYLMPYLESPASWRQRQVAPFEPSRSYFPALAGWGLRKPDYLAAQRRIGCEGAEFNRWMRLLLAIPASG